MPELARLLILAILTFVVAGVALLYSNPDLAVRIQRTLAGWVEPLTDGSATTLWVARPDQQTWVGLSGFPDRVAVSFPNPAQAGVMSGKLNLDLETALVEGGDGQVSVDINGRRRDVVVMEHGQRKRYLSYELLAEDLMAPAVDVVLESKGATGGGQICPLDTTNNGGAVSLLASSGLALTTAEPITDPEARLMAAAEALPFVYGTDVDAQAMAIWSLQYLARHGVDGRYVDPQVPGGVLLAPGDQTPISVDANGAIVLGGAAGVERLIDIRHARLPVLADAWPVPLIALTPETLSKSFRGTRRWTIDYRLADLPEGRMPTAMQLAMKLSTLSGGAEWMVRVRLNGNLVETLRFGGTIETVSVPVPLPVELQGLVNHLEIVLTDTSPQPDICSPRTDAEAQLLPETEFRSADPQPGALAPTVVRMLAAEPAAGIAVSGAGVDAAASLKASGILGKLLPLRTPVSFGTAGQGARLTVVNAATLEPLLAEIDSAAYVAVPDEAATDGLSVFAVPATAREELLASVAAGGVGLLLQW